MEKAGHLAKAGAKQSSQGNEQNSAQTISSGPENTELPEIAPSSEDTAGKVSRNIEHTATARTYPAPPQL